MLRATFGSCDRLGRTDHPELEFIARKGEGRGPVPVRIVLGDRGQRIHAHSYELGVFCDYLLAFCNLFQDFGQLLAQKDGDNGRRRFIGAETVIVARGCAGRPQDVRVDDPRP